MVKASILSHGVGRRKASVARVWLRQGKGEILVNGDDYQQYFDTEYARKIVIAPLKQLEIEKKFDIAVNVVGGGIVGQAGAVRLGIARALLESDASLRAALKKLGYLSVDSRKKERKKYGQKAARRKFQFVKR
jgi:small subunit ribosomal protein S9